MSEDKAIRTTFMRQLFILQHIPRHPNKTTVERVMQHIEGLGFQVERRTIERDLVSLSNMPELPLDCDHHKPRGWWWSTEAKMWDIPGMNTSMALTFALVDHYLDQKLPSSVLDHLKGYIEKSEEVLNRQHNAGYSQWVEKIAVIPSSIDQAPPEIDRNVMRVVYNALLLGHCFKGAYQTLWNDEIKQYKVHPLGLVFRESIVYLVATIKDYTDIVHLALNRFQDAEELVDKVTIPKGFNLHEYIKTGEFNFIRSEKKLKLKLEVLEYTAKRLSEIPLSEDQSIRPKRNGPWELSATVPDTDQLRVWIRSYGPYMKVIGPKRLKDEILEDLQETLDQYS